jgi:uncharacterized iron-regulated membrane protein
MTESTSKRSFRQWPDYRTIWRWHFYAGVFTIPFVLVLSVTGTIYLFKPQIEAWEERSFDQLDSSGTSVPLVDQINAAVASVDDGVFDSFEVPTHENPDVIDASRVLVRKDKGTIRVFVDPTTGVVLGSMADEERLTSVAKRIHGELMLGKRGSYLVELAASWTLVMVLTGITLWWPKSLNRLGGVLYPRLTRSGRVFWRDLHSVSGVWVSFLVVFLVVTGLPWATFWGDYFKSVRRMTGTDVVKQDWDGGHEHHDAHLLSTAQRLKTPKSPFRRTAVDLNTDQLGEIERVVSVAMELGLAPPSLIRPPEDGTSIWSVESVTGNRPLRKTVQIDATSGDIVRESGFGDRHWIDQVVGQGIALHEGQRFGLINQLLALIATAGLVLLSCSGVVLWWRRRSAGTFGAPAASVSTASVSWWRLVLLWTALVCTSVFLPLFGASLIVVLAIDRFVLPRLPSVRVWIGLQKHAA